MRIMEDEEESRKHTEEKPRRDPEEEAVGTHGEGKARPSERRRQAP